MSLLRAGVLLFTHCRYLAGVRALVLDRTVVVLYDSTPLGLVRTDGCLLAYCFWLLSATHAAVLQLVASDHVFAHLCRKIKAGDTFGGSTLAPLSRSSHNSEGDTLWDSQTSECTEGTEAAYGSVLVTSNWTFKVLSAPSALQRTITTPSRLPSCSQRSEGWPSGCRLILAV